ncbi:carbohydrate kinase family protein [Lysinibacillus sphaericus]|uniref:Fructokinase-1 n=1 Tax=Lysinibacillus sphaericus OT4b.31 TaxID=1285586 RepID=R7ZF59_LYSSH|nr:carbohydrate kinase [Lysinibacillus sphaericus]EON72634.1 fructokinase-1 [Lysinibacillus sphaericus OT4b.31]
MSKLYTIGELLIDFTPTGQSGLLASVEHFTKHAGGAPANVAAVCAKFGQQAALLSQVGQDAFGDFLIETLKQAGVETTYITQTTEGDTSLAFVSLTDDGERDFLFYRRNAADLLYRQEQLPTNLLSALDILHFCSVNLVESPMKQTHVALIEQAHLTGCLVSFDANIRLPLWHDAGACRKTIGAFLPKAHIIKLSDEELLFLTHLEDEQQAVLGLFQGKVQVILVTHGADGATLYTKQQHIKVPAEYVQAIDTTGAGDAFIGAVLTILLENNITVATLGAFCEQFASPLVTFANRYAGTSTKKQGAIASYPTKQELPFTF